jgi:replicative DNA helicase
MIGIEIEKIVIGSILLEEGLMGEALESLTPRDFHIESHRLIYRTMIEMYERREPVDLSSVMLKLMSAGNLDKVGGMANYATIVDGVCRTDTIAYYIGQMKGRNVVREIALAAEAISEKCITDPDDPDLIAECQRIFWQACDANLPSGFVSLGEAAFKYLELVESASGTGGIPSGFADVDSYTLGFQKTDLIILAARPSLGKTTLGFNMALSAAVAGHPVAFFSIEMKDERIGEKAVTLGAEVDSMRLRKGEVNHDGWRRLHDVADRAHDLPFFIYDRPRISPVEIRARCERMKREHGLGLIVADYLQLMARGGAAKFEGVGDNANEMKAIAKELDVPIILLSQLSRDIEKRGEGAEPVLSDLGESGEIERAADVVIFIYDDAETINQPNVVSIKIGKNRTGATGKFKMLYQKQFNRFADLAR